MINVRGQSLYVGGFAARLGFDALDAYIVAELITRWEERWGKMEERDGG